MTPIRTASFAALDARTAYLLWQLRESVFVVEQECPYLDLDGRDLEPETRHLWAEEDGRPVAYLRILAEPVAEPGSSAVAQSGSVRPGIQDGMRIGRVVVAESHRRQGLAEQLMRTALEVVDGRPCRLDAQSYLVDWYRRLGFEPCGEEFLDDGIPHVPMRRAT